MGFGVGIWPSKVGESPDSTQRHDGDLFKNLNRKGVVSLVSEFRNPSRYAALEKSNEVWWLSPWRHDKSWW